MILFAGGLAAILVGGITCHALGRFPRTAERLFQALVAGGCGLVLVAAAAVFAPVPQAAVARSLLAPAGPGAAFAIDPLSAWFLITFAGVGAIAALFGVPYLREQRDRRPVGLAHLLVAALLVGLSGVVTARTILSFLVSWEVMAISGWFLIMFEQDRAGVPRAGMIYLVLTHLSTLALFGMFTAWSGGHVDWPFAELARAAGQGTAPIGFVLTLGLVGFGIKAGMVPFHFWLPGAHAAAPSHASALLSGVVLKAGIYGLLRVLALIGPVPAWWGWTVLLFGLVSAVLGVLWALAQHDIKRLLAYHSVENIGIILLGVGLGALGTAYQVPALAVIGYAGALLHTLNHALFKSLLFLGAGVVAKATGTLEIDRLGGLARVLPRTAIAFLIGSAAIVGLPPLNGFASEWLVFLGLFQTGGLPGTIRAASVLTAGLALTGALALACFSKLYGVVFLGTARDAAAVPTGREDRMLALPQWVLAAACVVIGVAPGLLAPALERAATFGRPMGFMAPGPVLPTQGLFAISLVASAIILVSAAVWVARDRALSRRRRTEPTWGCAHDFPSRGMQYSASSFAQPLLAAFGAVAGSRLERAQASRRTHPVDLALDLIVRPTWGILAAAAARLRTIQSGGIRGYLLYFILCVLGLLLYVWAAAPR